MIATEENSLLEYLSLCRIPTVTFHWLYTILGLVELAIIGAVKMTNIDISVLDGDGNYEFEFKHPKKASFGTCEKN